MAADLEENATKLKGGNGDRQSIHLQTSVGMGSADMHEEDRGPPATKRELYSYYAFYAGNNGTGPFN